MTVEAERAVGAEAGVGGGRTGDAVGKNEGRKRGWIEEGYGFRMCRAACLGDSESSLVFFLRSISQTTLNAHRACGC
jgi:hypothetical protein